MSAIKIITVDCEYLLPRFAASYLVIDRSGDTPRAIVIDNGTTRSVPRIVEALRAERCNGALRAEGLGPEQVDFVIVTHVHLDHAGGSSALMKLCPGATLLAHPRAARHLADPAKLVASAKQVYGEAEFEKLYGTIDPIPEARIRVMADGEKLGWRSTELEFLHTRGHANHHFCVLVSEAGTPRAIFTGDAFGVCYPDLQPANGGVLIFPSTSPTDFDAVEARAAVRRIAGSGAPVAYPTHFGGVRDMGKAAAQLLKELDFSEALLNEAIASGEPDEGLLEFCRARIARHVPEAFARMGSRWNEDAARIFGLDMDLNAQGIAYVAIRKRRGTGK